MIRLAAAALLVTVCLGSAGCADNLLKERPLSRTAQTSGARPTDGRLFNCGPPCFGACSEYQTCSI